MTRRRWRRGPTLIAATAAAVLVSAPALAHVGVEVDRPRPGATADYTVSVPNESDDATTDRIEMQLPDGLEIVDTRPGRGGWTMTVEDGLLVIEGGRIAVGDRRDFRFTATNPPEPGELVFPAIQIYSDGEEVRWVGEEGSDRPAPRVVLRGEPVVTPTEAQAPAASPTPSPSPTAARAAPTPSAITVTPTEAASEPTGRDDSGITPTVLAVVVLAGIIVVVVAVTRSRR